MTLPNPFRHQEPIPLSSEEVRTITSLVDSSGSLDDFLQKLCGHYHKLNDYVRAAEIRIARAQAARGLHLKIDDKWPSDLIDERQRIWGEEGILAEQAGKLEQAGDLYYSCVDITNAARVYTQAGNREALLKAARFCALSGHLDGIAETYVKLKEFGELEWLLKCVLDGTIHHEEHIDGRFFGIVGDLKGGAMRDAIKERDRHKARKSLVDAIVFYGAARFCAKEGDNPYNVKILLLRRELIEFLVDWPDEKETEEISYYIQLARMSDVDTAVKYFLDHARYFLSPEGYKKGNIPQLNPINLQIEFGTDEEDMEEDRENQPPRRSALAKQTDKAKDYANYAYEILVRAGRLEEAAKVHQEWALPDSKESTLILRIAGRHGAAAEIFRQEGNPVEYGIDLFCSKVQQNAQKG